MQGADAYNEALSRMVKLEEFVSQSHALSPIRNWRNEALATMGSKPCQICGQPAQANRAALQLRQSDRPDPSSKDAVVGEGRPTIFLRIAAYNLSRLRYLAALRPHVPSRK